MLDYKLLAALAAVIEQGGFERAALTLRLSQSAVSQRIKLLEARVGQPVLLRLTPPAPTEVGRRLLHHVQQVRLLERDLDGLADADAQPERLRIALNADSLATWWTPAVSEFCSQRGLLFELLVEDQDVGLQRMRAGDVAACLCAQQRPVAGARSEGLGAMRYLALATPAFVARHLPRGLDEQAILRSPAVVFGPDDQLQRRYLQALGIVGPLNYHLCPSSEGFLAMVRHGLGWGMVPELQAQALLASGGLVELVPGRPLDVALYWHHWRNGSTLLSELSGHLLRHAQQALRQLPNGLSAC